MRHGNYFLANKLEKYEDHILNGEIQYFSDLKHMKCIALFCFYI